MENTAMKIFNNPAFGSQFTSFDAKSVEEKKHLYNVINNPDNRLSDFINREIDLRDVVINSVVLTADKSENAPEGWKPQADDQAAFRVILIDKTGVSYTATSSGIYNSVKNIFNIFGTLHFDDEMKMTVKQVATKNGRTLTLAFVD